MPSSSRRPDFDIRRVEPIDLGSVWPHIEGFIDSAFENGRGDDNSDTVLRDIVARRSILWVAWDGPRVAAAVTTKLITTRRGLVCRITTCGGGGVNWRNEIWRIEDYARAEGCHSTRLEGRRGWARVLPDYSEAWVVLEKRLA